MTRLTHSTVSRVVILLLIAVVTFIFVKYSYRSDNREAIVYSSLQCVQSICLENKATGEICSYRKPRISEILIETDKDNANVRNVRVIPSDDRCQ